MALYFILKAMDFPPGSEIIVPALTFWVVPEIARVAGLKPVFADIDPATFTLCPEAVERAITPNTRAVLPTHLYGLSCDMDPILDARAAPQPEGDRGLRALAGRDLQGPDGRDARRRELLQLPGVQAAQHLWRRAGVDARRRSREDASANSPTAKQWPTEKRVEGILRSGKWQHTFIRPKVFTYSLFPIWYAASWVNAKPEQRLWEKRPSSRPAARALPRPVHERAGGDRAGRPQAPARVHRAHQTARADARRSARRRAAASRSRRRRQTGRTCTTSIAPTCPTARRS